MQKNYTRIKYACYMGNFSMSVIAALSPLLFVTFRTVYNISYGLLGTLVLVNFFTQLLVDLALSFSAHKINMDKTIRLMPMLTLTGLAIYGIFPWLFPNQVYLGLLLGTILFSASGGLAEVLISPVIAAIPAKNPESEMSKLHSVYAWGVVIVVVLSTLFLRAFGRDSWQILTLIWIMVPLISAILFLGGTLPPLQTQERASNVLRLIFNKGFLFCVLCILFGGASEAIMSQWGSGYLEKALGIPKATGDIFGVAMFSVMLGLGRTLYAKMGKNIRLVQFAGAAGAFLCYIAAVVTNTPIIGLAACALTGLCTSMLWPGSLLVSSEKFPSAGVALYALMAAGGDLGCAIGPQLVGWVTDVTFAIGPRFLGTTMTSVSDTLGALPQNLYLEQLSMKAGLFAGAFFPLIAAVLFGIQFWGFRSDIADQ